MDNLYKEKYRTKTVRLSGWDYGSNGLYFVTICTKDRHHYFGEIDRTKSISVDTPHLVSSPTLSVEAPYLMSPPLPPTSHELETQGIVSLRATTIGEIAHGNWLRIPEFAPFVELDDFVIMPDHMHGIIYINKEHQTDWHQNKFGSQSQNLASIIREYKSSVKAFTTMNNIEFGWQAKYYDRIMRDEKEYLNVKQYIQENPERWLNNQKNQENY